jgi:hypothetical protein
MYQPLFKKLIKSSTNYCRELRKRKHFPTLFLRPVYPNIHLAKISEENKITGQYPLCKKAKILN